MPSALTALQNPVQPGPGGPGDPDARRKSIEMALLKKIQAEKLMGTFTPQQYQEAVDYYTKNNTMPTWEGMTSADTTSTGQTPPANTQTGAPTPSGPGLMDRVGAAVGHMVAHPIDTFNSMTDQMTKSLATAVASRDPQTYAQQLASPGYPSNIKALMGNVPPTAGQQNLATAQVAGTIAAPAITKFLSPALGSTLAETATGAGTGALWTPDDPAAGAIIGGGAGFAGAKIGEKLAARDAAAARTAKLTPKTPAVPETPPEAVAPNEATISPEKAAQAEIPALMAQRVRPPEVVPDAVKDMEIPAGVKTANGNGAAPAGLNIEPASAKEFGGEKVDFSKVDPQKVSEAQEKWATLTPNKRASLLGDKVMKAVMGDKPDARVVTALQEGDITKLPGYMQRGVLRAVGAGETRTGGVTPRAGKMTPAAPAESPALSVPSVTDVVGPDGLPDPAKVAAKLAALKTRMAAGAQVSPADAARLKEEDAAAMAPDLGPADKLISPKIKARMAMNPQQEGETLGNYMARLSQMDEQPAASQVTKRQGKLKRADVLNGAPRTQDGMLDWDKLNSDQRAAIANAFGKDYRQKVQTMSLAQMQAVLKPAQMDVVIKQLSRAPKAVGGAEAAAPAAAAPGAEAPTGAPASAPEEVQTPTTVSRRGKMTPVETEEPPTSGSISAPSEPVIAAQEKPSGMTPAGYNKLTPEMRSGILQEIMKRRQIPGDPRVMAELPFEALPPIYRREVPTMQAPAIAGEPVGGAASEAAGFPGKPRRRPTGKRK